jgi:hypothetical protein
LPRISSGFERARTRAAAGFALIAMGAMAGFLPAFGNGQTARELSPAETVSFRFPPTSRGPAAIASAPAAPAAASPANPAAQYSTATTPATGSSPAPRATAGRPSSAPLPAPYAVASAGASDIPGAPGLMFSPHPIYPIGALPQQALGYADPATETAAPRAAPAAVPLERTARATERRPAPTVRPARDPHLVFNEAQIASIKERLALTPKQEAHWPAVAAALRGLTRRQLAAVKTGSASDARITSVDPNGAEVQRLKYAAMPLLMSMREDQKQEVRTLLHLIGLGHLASQF